MSTTEQLWHLDDNLFARYAHGGALEILRACVILVQILSISLIGSGVSYKGKETMKFLTNNFC